MKLQLTFKEEDFDTLRKFEAAVERQLGPNVYVGTDSMVLYFDYPTELKAFLSVMVKNKTYHETYRWLDMTFTPKDFQSLRNFEKSVKKQRNDQNVYVMNDCLAYFFDYPKELSLRLRPMYSGNQLKFELESSLPDAESANDVQK
jgi:hypothetical protein